MGRVAVQAQAAGCPVIASRVSGLQDVVKDGETGLLVPPGDSQAIAAAVIRCLTDPALAAAIAAHGRRAAESYGIAPMIAKIEQTYRDALAARFGPAAVRS
jgi:glycosyltransferase involved in cell wall biosynthesis